MDANQQKTTPITSPAEIQAYIFSDEIAATHPLALSSIRYASPEAWEVVPINNWKAKEVASDVMEEAFRRSKLSFWSDICLRGPAVCVKSILRKYSDHCKIRRIEDFGNGIAQAYVFFFSDAYVFEILRQNPILRAACFVYIGRANGVAYSETGCAGFSDEEMIDVAKDEGEHWMREADVLKDTKYEAFDIRNGLTYRGDYEFPFQEAWESALYVFKENGQRYLICPAGTDVEEIMETTDYFLL